MQRIIMLAIAGTALSGLAPPPEDPLAPEIVPEVTVQLDDEGRPVDEGRIVGGDTAKKGTAKWQVELFTEPVYSDDEKIADGILKPNSVEKQFLNERDPHELGHKCGGSYIGGGWVVTAAHCVVIVRKPPKAPFNPMRERLVRMGTQNLNVGGAKFTIDAVVIHSGYSDSVKKHDIALVHVRETGRIVPMLGSTLQEIPLQKPTDGKMYPEEPLRVTGWGWMGARTPTSLIRRDVNNQLQRSPADLQELSLLYYADGRCTKETAFRGIADDKFNICAGSRQPNEDSCQGDSGGPLTRSQSGVRKLVGIVSIGVGCAYKGKPAIYTRVSAYYNWIEAAKKQPLGKISYLAHVN